MKLILKINNKSTYILKSCCEYIATDCVTGTFETSCSTASEKISKSKCKQRKTTGILNYKLIFTIKLISSTVFYIFKLFIKNC